MAYLGLALAIIAVILAAVAIRRNRSVIAKCEAAAKAAEAAAMRLNVVSDNAARAVRAAEHAAREEMGAIAKSIADHL